MLGKLFTEGGPPHIRSVGNDQYRMSFEIPTDEDGRIARQCPIASCSPGFFKVKPGTGIPRGQLSAFCPYCKHGCEPSAFTTQEQTQYAKSLVIREAHKGINKMFSQALGLGASGKRKIGSGLISMELSYKTGTLPPVRQPFEDEVRRDVICPHCTLNHTVFGLATWCADCGRDIFMTHVSAELAVTRLMLHDVDRRMASLGKRVAAKDMENCLEDASLSSRHQ